MSLQSEWVKLEKGTSDHRLFAIAYVEHPLIDDLQSDGTLIMKLHDHRNAFDPLLHAPKGISTVRALQFKRGAIPQCQYLMMGKCDVDVAVLKRGQKLRSLINAINPLVLRRAYQTFLPIKAAKLVDVKQLLGYVHLPEQASFY